MDHKQPQQPTVPPKGQECNGNNKKNPAQVVYCHKKTFSNLLDGLNTER